jgi:pilus assembly protein CpaB
VKPRRRRGLLLLSVALASGGLAASQVRERERSVAAQVGPGVPVLLAARDLPVGARVSARALAVRRVPARFVPPDALASAAGVVGLRPSAPIAAGGYVTAGLFEGSNDGHRGVEGVGRGERAVTVGVSGATGLAVGSRVDVLVSTESGAGGGRTLMALAGAELLRLGPGPGGEGHGYEGAQATAGVGPDGAGADAGGAAPGAGTGVSEGTTLATLRVSLRQAVYLTAADNFAREIRLLARPRGDRSAAGAAVSQGQL